MFFSIFTIIGINLCSTLNKYSQSAITSSIYRCAKALVKIVSNTAYSTSIKYLFLSKILFISLRISSTLKLILACILSSYSEDELLLFELN